MRRTRRSWWAWIVWPALALATGGLNFLGSKGVAAVWAYLTSR